MAHKLNDLSLGATSAIPSFQDSPRDVTLTLVVTPTERRQLQEMAHHAGRVSETPLPDGDVLVQDESPNGENLLYLKPDTTAVGLVDEGWYLWSEPPVDDYRGSTAMSHMQASLKRICGADNARGITEFTTEFLAHDF